MIIVMKPGATPEQVQRISQELESKQLKPTPLIGTELTVIAVIGDERKLDVPHFEALPGVNKVMRVLSPYKLVSKDTKKQPTIIEVNGVKIGSNQLAAMAGPCAVENEEQMDIAAKRLSAAGIKILRGGAYKPRTAPYSFQGLREKGLKMIREAADRYNMAVITEVLDTRDVEKVANHADILQIGARNMQNFELLKEVGKSHKPVFLKRGMSATVNEFLLAAEYIVSSGNPNVMLCERGIRTFETATRNTLSLATVPLIKEMSHLPIIVDPTHATGKKSLIEPMIKAAIAAGADGFMVEVHPQPEKALCDAKQQITPDEFEAMLERVKPVAAAVGKEL